MNVRITSKVRSGRAKARFCSGRYTSMRNNILILVAALTGCSTVSEVTKFEMYSEQPIDINCAVSTLESIPIIKKAWLGMYSIKFIGKGFKGEFYHGTEGDPLLGHGLTINKKPRFGKSSNELANELTYPIYNKCAV